jgi:DNA-binding protein H-NS
MAQQGLTLADLAPRGPVGAGKPRGSTKKVPPKYRDPATDRTRTGRGLQPTWLRQALAGGARIEDFLI